MPAQVRLVEGESFTPDELTFQQRLAARLPANVVLNFGHGEQRTPSGLIVNGLYVAVQFRFETVFDPGAMDENAFLSGLRQMMIQLESNLGISRSQRRFVAGSRGKPKKEKRK